jgi:hypothetical protein
MARPFTPVLLRPGINVEETPLLNSTGYSMSQNIRFWQGMPQKIGGYTHLNQTPLVGICTGMHSWADLLNNPYIACGTDQRLELFAFGIVYDITPLRKTSNPSPAFTTTISTPTVSVLDATNGASQGDWINVFVPVSIGGIILQGFYQIVSITDANDYVINVGVNAAASVTGGTVPAYTSTMSSATVNVLFANHGLITGSLWTVHVATTVGGIVLAAGSTYSVTLVDTNNFTIVGPTSAGSGATVSENSGNAQIQYLVPTGLQSATAGSGYGAGTYGSGLYGGSNSSGTAVPLRQWFLGNFGQELVGNYNGSPIFIWTPPVGIDNPALILNTTNFPSAVSPPKAVNVSFVLEQAEIVVALGVDEIGGSGAIDPLNIRWSDGGNNLDWFPTVANLAGSYRLSSGSRIVGGLPIGLGAAIWTDIGMWSMTYIGAQAAELVFGFNPIANGCGLLSARACCAYMGRAYWASNNNFFMYDGSAVQTIPCPVWDQFWFDLDKAQVDKIQCAVNSYFGEVTWYYPSASGNGTVDSTVTLNVLDGSWDFGRPPVTAWIDTGVYGAPIGTDQKGLLQQFESGTDADGTPLPSSVRSGWFAIQEGGDFGFIEQIILDAVVAASPQGAVVNETGGGVPGAIQQPTPPIQVTLYSQDYPSDPVYSYGPFSWSPGAGPQFFNPRSRSRTLAISIASSSLGIFWRLGKIRHNAAPAGNR